MLFFTNHDFYRHIYFIWAHTLPLLYLHLFIRLIVLTRILLKPKAICLCHQYRTRSVCASCSLTRLYTVGWPTLSFHLDIPKIIMDSSKNRGWIIPFMKFSRVRVNSYFIDFKAKREINYSVKTDDIFSFKATIFGVIRFPRYESYTRKIFAMLLYCH